MTVLDAGRLVTRRPADTLFRFTTAACASIVLILLAGMLIRTTWSAWPAFSHSGIGIITSNTWNPNANQFGGLSFIYGTLVTSFIALVLGVPVSVLIALFLTEIAPARIGTPLGYVIDLLAAVPSVVYGLWGVFVLVPFLTNDVWQPLSNNLSFVPLFSQFAMERGAQLEHLGHYCGVAETFSQVLGLLEHGLAPFNLAMQAEKAAEQGQQARAVAAAPVAQMGEPTLAHRHDLLGASIP